jgi:putative effector of murein hydrolase LrgA (UPF0299 family)
MSLVRPLVAPRPRTCRLPSAVCRLYVSRMDLLTLAGLAMIGVWAAAVFALEAPGIIHGLLSLGVFFIVLGAIKRSEKKRGGAAK